MTALKKCAAGWTPAAPQSTGLAANEPQQVSPSKAFGAMQSAKSRLAVQSQSGQVLYITGKPAAVARSLIAAGQGGLSRLDVQPWCWDLASAVRDLRALLGRDAIQRLPGNRCLHQPCRYRLIEALTVLSPALVEGGSHDR